MPSIAAKHCSQEQSETRRPGNVGEYKYNIRAISHATAVKRGVIYNAATAMRGICC